MTRRRAAVLALAATSTLTLSTLATNAASAAPGDHVVRLAAQLTPQNDSGATGRATATVRGTTIEQIDVTARGLTPDGPHAMHIHYGDEARNECPKPTDDSDQDGFVSAAEGVPAYGPIVVSLTTSGGTGAGLGDALALDRAPVATGGALQYSRSGISFTDVAGTGYAGGGTAAEIAASIRAGEGVLVIHGVDHDGSGTYNVNDAVRGAESELVPAVAGVPAEAVDPATCGVLRVARAGR